MIFQAVVKGTPEQAISSASNNEVEVLATELFHSDLYPCGYRSECILYLCARTQASVSRIQQWFCKDNNSPPYVPGSLLYFTEIMP